MKSSKVNRDQLLFEVNPTKPLSEQKNKNSDGWVFDIMDALTSPILTFSENWADTIPSRLLKQVPMARMFALLKKEELATYLECSIYIYTRTLEAPMDSDWTDIYTHVSCQSLQDCFSEDHWDEVKAPRTLNDWLEGKLKRLRQHIYIKRREILKRRQREMTLPANNTVEVTTPKKNACIQTSLFKF